VVTKAPLGRELLRLLAMFLAQLPLGIRGACMINVVRHQRSKQVCGI